MSRPAEFEAPKQLLGKTGVTHKLVARACRFLNALAKIEVKSSGRDRVSYSDSGILIEVKGGEATYHPRSIRATLTFAGLVPVYADVRDAIQDAYDAVGTTPKAGDIVYMTQFHYLILEAQDITKTDITLNGVFRFPFWVNDVRYTAFQIGPNRLL